jgi:hypothetical protein
MRSAPPRRAGGRDVGVATTAPVEMRARCAAWRTPLFRVARCRDEGFAADGESDLRQ